jgi:outer membrane murein-binding lipoprotein Lpp
MNALMSKKMILIAAVAIVTPLSGCIGGSASKTEPVSPLAPRVQELVDTNRHYPRWEDFPAAPTDLPPVTQVASNVQRLQGDSATLTSEIARIDWTLIDPEALAAETAAAVTSVPVSPDTARTQADIEAFAQSLRDRAKAPPALDRRPTQ